MELTTAMIMEYLKHQGNGFSEYIENSRSMLYGLLLAACASFSPTMLLCLAVQQTTVQLCCSDSVLLPMRLLLIATVMVAVNECYGHSGVALLWIAAVMTAACCYCYLLLAITVVLLTRLLFINTFAIGFDRIDLTWREIPVNIYHCCICSQQSIYITSRVAGTRISRGKATQQQKIDALLESNKQMELTTATIMEYLKHQGNGFREYIENSRST
ncbi:hypothetical protein RHMOL_Rhmol02G0203500 [Rhododendron molle]|uniref:Uncharacterized protein n=1 Tax=Rhododendron molle TaxID=49168 RepID=A0ACC0PUZ2_RHOML|nr:hypothetical protein RHMOL_Rhmol02G0203500 [Rhododendron molle]